MEKWLGVLPLRRGQALLGRAASVWFGFACAEAGQVEFSTGGEERGGEGVRLKSGQRG